MLQAVFKSNERSEDSYIGVGGFLFSFFSQEKSENLFTLNFDFSRFEL